MWKRCVIVAIDLSCGCLIYNGHNDNDRGCGADAGRSVIDGSVFLPLTDHAVELVV